MGRDQLDGALAGLGAVVLSFGHDERYRDILSDLHAAGLAAERVVVVHNPYGPDDRWTPSPPNGVKVLRMPSNVGYGAAMNAGVAHLADRADGVLLLTHEVRLAPGALDRLAEALRAAPEYGILGPSVDLRQADGSTKTSYGGELTPRARALHVSTPPPLDDRGIGEVPWVDGCAMLVRPGTLSEAGPICARYFMYWEEAELADRARGKGWRVGVVPEARVSSEPGHSKRPGAYGYLVARNGLRWATDRGGRKLAGRFARDQLILAWWALRWSFPFRMRAGSLLAIGRVAGLCAALAGRWGPPPPILVKWTDIAPAGTITRRTRSSPARRT